MRPRTAGVALGAGGFVAAALARPALDALVARAEAHVNRVHPGPDAPPSQRAVELHDTLDVADLHADSLLWGRDLLVRGTRGHVDVPRLIEGRVALQVLAAAVKVPWGLRIVGNVDTTDDVLPMALAQRWPVATWTSPLARALHLAARAHRFAARSAGAFRVIETAPGLGAYLAERGSAAAMTAGLLAIEGAHALGDDPANVDVVAEAGYRMISPAHFFDTAFGGSAHGAERGGLTRRGRELIRRMEARGLVVDVAHASAATIDDVIRVATRPVVASHTGARAVRDTPRNLSEDQIAAIAATGGVVGVGFWEDATGGRDAAAIARSISHVVDRVGVEHVALGSDWDGSVAVPFDAAGIVRLTDALVGAGFDDDAIRAVMGGNVLRVLARVLPAA